MPDTWKETTFTADNGREYPMFNVYLGENKYDSKKEWFGFGVKKAQAILENIDALRAWVDKHER